ncbi:hypothetical protein ACTS9E_14530 [Empedobacter brevis]
MELAPLQTLYKNALITSVKLKNGKTTQMITVFNSSELNFEELNIGVKKGLERTRKAESMQSTLYILKGSETEPVIHFEKQLLRDYKPELDKTLNQI